MKIGTKIGLNINSRILANFSFARNGKSDFGGRRGCFGSG